VKFKSHLPHTGSPHCRANLPSRVASTASQPIFRPRLQDIALRDCTPSLSPKGVVQTVCGELVVVSSCLSHLDHRRCSTLVRTDHRLFSNTENADNLLFHTVQGLAPPRPLSENSQEAPKPTTNGVTKRITTPHACAECKRRKIRCDGRQPCGQCLGCRSPKPCYYDKHRQRVIPSRKCAIPVCSGGVVADDMTELSTRCPNL
jgi:hypothetical protein